MLSLYVNDHLEPVGLKPPMFREAWQATVDGRHAPRGQQEGKAGAWRHHRPPA